MKASELNGPALDLAVSKASNPEGRDGWGWFERDEEGFLFDPLNECRYSPSTDWAQGGPIIDRERITIRYWSNVPTAHAYMPFKGANLYEGETALIAAMRCFVASKLGDEIDVPEELLK